MSDGGDDVPVETELEAELEGLVHLESDLSERAALTASDVSGSVVGATRVDARDVPADYPVRITTEFALRLDVQVTGDAAVSVYVEWPSEYRPNVPLARLLDAVDVAPDEFANIYGESVDLIYREGHHVLDLGWTDDELRTAAVDESGRAASQDQTPETVEGSFGRRAGAFAVDLFLTGSVMIGLWLLFLLLQLTLLGPEDDILGAFAISIRGVSWVLLAVVVGTYFVAFDSQFGGTIGKRAMGLTVASTRGESIGVGRAGIRTAVLMAPLPLVALLEMFLWILGLPVGILVWIGWVVAEGAVARFTDRHRRLGDLVAGTVVVADE